MWPTTETLYNTFLFLRQYYAVEMAIAVVVMVVINMLFGLWFKKAIGENRSKDPSLEVKHKVNPDKQLSEGGIGIIEFEGKEHKKLFRDKNSLRPNGNKVIEDVKTPVRARHSGVHNILADYYNKSTRFASNLDETQFGELYSMAKWKDYNLDEVIFHEGTKDGLGIYVLVHGSVEMYQNIKGKAVKIRQYIDRGDHLGELTLLAEYPWDFSLKATSNTTIVYLSKKAVLSFWEQKPKVMISFIQTTVGREWRIARYILYEALRAMSVHNTFHEHFNCFFIPKSSNSSSSSNIVSRNNNNDKPLNGTVSSSFQQEAKEEVEIKTKNNQTQQQQQLSQSLEVGGDNKREDKKDAMLRLRGFINDDLKEVLAKFLHQRREDATTHVFFQAGQIIREKGGQFLTSMYILLEGKVALYREDFQQDAILLPGSLIGAVEHTTSVTSAHTVRAITNCRLAPIGLHQLPDQIGLRVTATVASCLSPLLRQFNKLGGHVRYRKAGRMLYRRGEIANEFFIIVSGRIGVLSSSDEGNRAPPKETAIDDKETAKFLSGRGDWVGEAAFLRSSSSPSYLRNHHPHHHHHHHHRHHHHRSGHREHHHHHDRHRENENKEHMQHSHSAICIRDTEYLAVSTGSFKLITSQFPRTHLRISSMLAARLHQALASSKRNHEKNIATVAMLPITPRADDDLELYAESLKTALNSLRLGNVVKLSADRLESLLGIASAHLRTHTKRSQVSAWLAEMEEQNRFLLLLADSKDSQWTRLCVRTADHILLVADSRDKHDLSAAERSLFTGERMCKTLADTELVLVHPSSTLFPRGTAEWLRRRQRLNLKVTGVHHVKRGTIRGIQERRFWNRIARVLSHHAVGLVLGGGGARGLAHQGVLAACKEKNIPIDFIGGTSQGSLMAALYAMYLNAEAMRPTVERFSTKMGSICELVFDATLPVMSYFSGKRFNNTIKDAIPHDLQIEDLWIPFFCITTNISKHRFVVHRQGSCWKAVRASMSLMEYLPPMLIDGDLLVDGGYLNNLPGDVMRDLFRPAFIMGVDVESNFSDDLYNVTDFGDDLSGFWICYRRLLGQLSPFTPRLRMPKFTELVSAVEYINNTHNIQNLRESGDLDLYIKPKLANTNLLDYHKLDQIEKIGFVAAEQQLNDNMDRIPKAFLLPTWELEDMMEMSKSYCEGNIPEPIISPIPRNRSTKSVAMLSRGATTKHGRAASIGAKLSTSAPKDEPGFLSSKPETLRSKSYNEEQVEVEVISSIHSKRKNSRSSHNLRIADTEG